MFGKKTNPINTKPEAIEELITRRLESENIFPSKDEVIKKLGEGKRLRIYLGIDPTGPNLHLGHTIPLLFLKQLWQIGHTPVLVIGDFTARIGDPTGKDTTRKALTKGEVESNMENYLGQVHKILPKGSFEVKYNSSWLSMSLEKFMNIAGHATVQQLQARSMFRERMEKESPLGVHEFLYPLLQGYDSVAMDIDGEVGGNDQTFNMLIGRDLEKKLLNKDKLVFATRLLVDAESGKKMSKTEGGLISLSDSPEDMFGKTMKTVPDEMIATVFELCTEKSLSDINTELIKQNPYEWKKNLAFELVRMYHGQQAAQKAAEEFDKVFSKKELPDEIQEFSGKDMEIIDIITSSGMAESRSEGKRLLEQGAVRINQNVVTEWTVKPQAGDIVQVGPRKFIKIK